MRQRSPYTFLFFPIPLASPHQFPNLSNCCQCLSQPSAWAPMTEMLGLPTLGNPSHALVYVPMFSSIMTLSYNVEKQKKHLPSYGLVCKSNLPFVKRFYLLTVKLVLKWNLPNMHHLLTHYQSSISLGSLWRCFVWRRGYQITLLSWGFVSWQDMWVDHFPARRQQSNS